ncbi:hypothetical protein B0T21DRAFT_294215 [Apiosordaria backusii]|uniref:Magnesium transporter n=1 Tax=Apiosordaria backusii TaxID=314023 RepID=A0AA40E655_9PEZI|nr:hypothetical protein B0T21DRAFT_294215 [Apiosordaria backusii]
MGLIGGLSPGGSIALGIIVGLLSTSVQSLGLTLQRKSHILEDEKGPYDVRRPPYRRRRWQLGMGMFIISNVLGSSIQISMLPLPVLSTLQASGLVFNSICATLILGEPFTRWSLWGTLLVCSGAVLIAVFGAIPSPTHTLKELLYLLGRRPFVIWMSFQAVIVIAIAVATEIISHCTTWMQDKRFRLARGFAYGCISGILSAHSLLVAKSAVELIISTIVEKDNQFVHWQSWMLVLGLVTLALSQLYYLHRGLKLVSTSVLYPLIFCVYNIIAILDGLIYFRQTDLIGPLRACLIALGTAILLSGVLALSWRLSDEQHTPGVGQSSLAPGLGLVEDTDGEEEEEELLLHSALGDEEEARPLPPSHFNSYQTFKPSRATVAGPVETQQPQPTSPLVLPKRQRPMRSTRTVSNRWTERAEIWDELEDRESPEPMSPALNRRRSTTLPARETIAARQAMRRGLTDFPILGDAPADTEPLLASSASPRRDFRRRRKSTGFPGFTARRNSSRKTPGGGLQDAVGSLWKMRWWRGGTKSVGGTPILPTTEDSPHSRSVSWGGEAGEPYRDEPAAEAYREEDNVRRDPRLERRSRSGSGSGTRRPGDSQDDPPPPQPPV